METARVIVHLVHGTWGKGWWFGIREGLRLWPPLGWLQPPELPPEAPEDFKEPPPLDRRAWFLPDSPFRRGVWAALPPGADVTFRHFLWSGSNSFTARETAAVEFRNYLSTEVERQPSARHLIVAHSHGGNVAVQAIGEQPENWHSIAGVLTMATPFLGRRCETNPQAKAFTLTSLFLAVAIPLTLLVFYGRLQSAQASMGVLLFLLAAVGVFLMPRWSTWKSWATLPHIAYSFIALAISWNAWNAARMDAWRKGSQRAFDQSIEGAACGAVFFTFLGVALVAVWSGCLPKDRARHCLEDLARKLMLMLLLLAIPIQILLFQQALARNDDNSGLLLSGPFLIACIFIYSGPAKVEKKFAPRPWSDPIYRLPCSLLAIRLPSDEAALVIGLSQSVAGIGELLFNNVLGNLTNSYKVLFGRGENAPTWLKGAVWIYQGFLMLIFVSYAILNPDGMPASELALVVAVMALAAPLNLFTSHILLIMVTFPIWWICATLVSIAVGAEALLRVPAHVVECEPLPKCPPEQVQLVIPWDVGDRGQTALRHAIYEAPEIQNRVAKWIDSFTGR